ncbi:MAG: nicotinate (nicotinamide) nucleotide adenylyltransferase [Balneolia bacterium]|nr:nicotinate (nicotinamide) nucleotide adenylyltransferase [Balneolia bacterium]
MKKSTERTVGIFGGTFDPVHQAHVQVVESLLASGLCDEIWVIPALESPFKQGRETATFNHRFHMAEIAFSHLNCVKVLDTETRLPKPSYTADTLAKLREEYPDTDFRLCIGSDNLSGFHRWHKYKELLDSTGLIVAERPGFNAKDVQGDVMAKATFVKHKPMAHSSTEVRREIADARFPCTVPEEVLRYIQEHGLYSAS